MRRARQFPFLLTLFVFLSTLLVVGCATPSPQWSAADDSCWREADAFAARFREGLWKSVPQIPIDAVVKGESRKVHDECMKRSGFSSHP